MINSEFNYILEKINDVSFIEDPFKFVYIEDFLSKEHFEEIVDSKQINIQKHASTEELIADLFERGYSPIAFPGCTTNVNDYLKWYYTKNAATPFHAHGLIEGFGMAFRLNKHTSDVIQSFIDFLNSKLFLNTMMKKFNKSGSVRVETAIQKYLTGYEISPHPDIRKKCLTYMLNINQGDAAEKFGLSTEFQKFKPEKEKIYDLWQRETHIDRCWVPWSWCDTVFKQVKNNSITMFAPYDRSLHAVKLKYNHLETQRTQVYGNLWYNIQGLKPTSWRELEKRL